MTDPAGLWLDRAPAPEPTPLPSDFAGRPYDVVVIGAGLAGLATAAALIDDGADVLVLEARSAGERTSGHSTAKVTALHGLIYAGIERAKGRDAAALYAAANQQGVLDWRTLIERRGVDCDWTTATAFTCAATQAGRAAVEEEAEAAARAGLDVYTTAELELPTPVVAAVALADQAHVDPVKLCRGLTASLNAEKPTVIPAMRVVEVTEDATGCTVRALDGEDTELDISADMAVLCTHLPIVDPAFLAARTRPERSYVVAGPSEFTPAGMYIAPDAGWSIRPATGPGRPIVLVGGEGHAMADHVSSDEQYRRLEAWAATALGVDVQQRWSAFDYHSVDGLPFIGRLGPRSKRRFVATGFGKWGLTTSMVAATVIADLVAGRRSETSNLFDSTRLGSTLGIDLVSTNLHVARRFLGDRLHGWMSSPSDLGAAEGRVERHGARLIARSRDRDGVERAVDARCTHLGCIVGFNDGDQTWDCPCHGSRFDLDGSVLDGPARYPLKSVDADGGDSSLVNDTERRYGEGESPA